MEALLLGSSVGASIQITAVLQHHQADMPCCTQSQLEPLRHISIFCRFTEAHSLSVSDCQLRCQSHGACFVQQTNFTSVSCLHSGSFGMSATPTVSQLPMITTDHLLKGAI